MIAACVFQRAPTTLMRLAGISCLLLAVGCQEVGDRPHVRREPTEVVQEDDFQRAMDLIYSLDEFDREQASLQVSFHLNQWLAEQPAADWTRDPLLSRLPRGLQQTAAVDTVDRQAVNVRDVSFFQEVLWLRQISNWVAEQRPDPHMAQWLKQAEQRLGTAAANKLRIAERLFDWTVRNIQLDPLLPPPKEAVAGPGGDQTAPRSTAGSPAERAEPGPGYTYAPWQVLLYGHGDAWQRARVFILLARQQGIDVVMLAIGQPGQPDRPRPWAPAALVENELYLFDTQLGLPIPDASGFGIATLKQLRSQPALLRALDFGNRFQYSVSSQDLDSVEALVDACPESLSQRMKTIEARLTGQQQLVLTVAPSKLARQLRQIGDVQRVGIWSISLEAPLYVDALAERIDKDPAAQAAYVEERAAFLMPTSLVKGRHLHFRHQFEREEEKPGAKLLYMEMRLSDDEIDRLATDVDIQKTFGLERQPGERQDDWLGRLAFSRLIWLQAKLHASYWIGLVHYETGNYTNAANWFDDRTLKATPKGPWTDGARYNLARCFESMGQWEKARQLLLADESPQQHGNLLRARQLEQLVRQSPQSRS